MKEKISFTEERGTLGALLRLPYQRLLVRLYGRLAESGFADIRPAHSSVFRNIQPGGSRVTDLADRAQLTKQSMAYLVTYLEEKGYVNLSPDPEDGRAKLVCLTERGHAFMDAALDLSKRIELELAETMGTAGVERLRELLAEAAEAMA